MGASVDDEDMVEGVGVEDADVHGERESDGEERRAEALQTAEAEDAMWEERYRMLEEYKSVHGHICVPQHHVFSNGDRVVWLSRVRVRWHACWRGLCVLGTKLVHAHARAPGAW